MENHCCDNITRPRHVRSLIILAFPVLVLYGAWQTSRDVSAVRNVRLLDTFKSSCSSQSSPSREIGASPVSSKQQLLSEYRVCHVPPHTKSGYVCRGPEYEAFADKLESLLLEKEKEQQDNNNVVGMPHTGITSLWGKRKSPFPANSTILAVGNSLIRQTFSSLACQYEGRGLRSWISPETKLKIWGTFYEGQFDNGSKLYLVTNHPMFYSPKWPDYLREMIGMDDWNGRPKLDGIFMGRFNTFKDAYNTSFMELMKEQTKDWEGANFAALSPPTLLDFAKIYDGPIVGVSMMADWSPPKDQDYYNMAEHVNEIRKTANGLVRSDSGLPPDTAGDDGRRSRIDLVHGRRYVAQLGECGSNDNKDVGPCFDVPKMHRCIGSRGGHPDLILWDALEAMNTLLTSLE